MKDTLPIRIAHNLIPPAGNDLGGEPNAGEGMGVRITAAGRRIPCNVHENKPMAFLLISVTEPSRPETNYCLISIKCHYNFISLILLLNEDC